MNLLGFGKQRGVGGGNNEERMRPTRPERSHSWDSSFLTRKGVSMMQRQKQHDRQRRAGFGVKDRQLRNEKQDEGNHDPSPLIVWNRTDTEGIKQEEEVECPVPKELQQQLFIQKLFVISKKHLDETPPERRMSLISARSFEEADMKELEAPTLRTSLISGPQTSYVSAQQTSEFLSGSKPTTTQEVSRKDHRHRWWSVETVVTSLTSSCTAFDSLCTPSTFSTVTRSRPAQRRRNGLQVPAIPSHKRRSNDPLAKPIPIPMTISFTKEGPPPGWEEQSLERHFPELESRHTNTNIGEIYDYTEPVIVEPRQKEDDMDASSSGFISLSSSIPTRRSHGLWSTTELYTEYA